MEINFSIDQEDLKVLFIATGDINKNTTFNHFIYDCEASYEEYFERCIKTNRKPKTFSQWINGQTIALTS